MKKNQSGQFFNFKSKLILKGTHQIKSSKKDKYKIYLTATDLSHSV